jgi:two-component system, oxyanion-binding sensor
VREGIGWCPTWSAAQAPGQPEKVLMVAKRFADTRAAEHAALVAALTEACAWCDEPQNREPLAQLLAEARWLNLPARVIAPALVGRFDCGAGRVENVPDFHVFHRGEANVPTVEKAVVLQRALGAAGLLPASVANNPELPRQLFREDLFRAALLPNPLHEISSSPTVA